MSETIKSTDEQRLPNFFDVGDVDLAWSEAEQRIMRYKTPEETAAWWWEQQPDLDGAVPMALKHSDPNRLYRYIFTTFS